MGIRPTSSTTINLPYVGDVIYEFARGTGMFVALDALPPVSVPSKNGSYSFMPVEAFMKRHDVKRQPGGHYNRAGFEFEDVDYACFEYAEEVPVDDSKRAEYASLFDIQVAAGNVAAMILLREQEVRAADLLFSTSTFSGRTSAVTTEWDDLTNATPVQDAKTAIAAIEDACGLSMAGQGWALMSRKVYRNLRLNDEVKGWVQYNVRGMTLEIDGGIPADAVAQALGVSKLLIGGGRYDSADEGQSQSLVDVWDDEYCLFAINGSGPPGALPQLGRTLAWNEDGGVYTAETYRDESVRGEVMRVRQHLDEKILNTACGYLLSNITT